MRAPCPTCNHSSPQYGWFQGGRSFWCNRCQNSFDTKQFGGAITEKGDIHHQYNVREMLTGIWNVIRGVKK